MLIIPANSASASGGYAVDNSLRFNSGSSDYLSRSNGTPTSLRKYTFSAWVKKTATGALHTLYSNGTNADNYMYIHFRNDTEQLEYVDIKSGAYQVNLRTNRVFRDPSAWYHVMIAVDTTQGTNTNRVKLYINGVQETSFHTATYPDQNDDLILNGSNTNIGRYTIETDRHFNGYMSEVVFVDGTQQANTDLGEFDEDSGIWKPIDVSGLTFGDNGYYLEFKQAGTSQNSSGMGADTSGEDNHFAVNNLTAIDQTTDTCTLNYNTMNPLNMPVSNKPTFSEGNLKTVTSSSGSGRFGGTSTFGVTSGKWYVEAKATIGATYSRNSIGVSYDPAEMARNNSDNTLTNTSYAWGWDSSNGDVYHDSSVVVNYASYATGDICQIFLDLDNHKLYYGKNGTLQSSTGISLDTGETYFIAQIDRTGGSDTSTFEFNFGSPIYAISSSNTDGEYGNFEYSTTITGDGASKTFKALNTKNLAEYG